MTKKKTSIKIPFKITWGNHFMNFLSVVVGVLLAFGLNDWNENNKLNRKVDRALENLKKEIEANRASTQETYDANYVQFQFISEVLNITNDTMGLTVSQDSFDAIAMKYFGVGQSETEQSLIDIDLYSLSEVAYLTILETNVISEIDFEMASRIQETYILQAKLRDFDDDIIDEIKTLDYDKEGFKRIVNTISVSNQLVNQLLDKHFPETLERLEEYSNQ